MQTFADIIVAFGGYAKVAEALSIPAGTVSSWKSRNVFPSEHWEKLVATASERGIDGVSLEALARIAARSVAPSMAEVS